MSHFILVHYSVTWFANFSANKKANYGQFWTIFQQPLANSEFKGKLASIIFKTGEL